VISFVRFVGRCAGIDARLFKLVEVDDRVLDQAAGERVPKCGAATLVGRRVLAGVQQVLEALDLGEAAGGGERASRPRSTVSRRSPSRPRST
jgi:hypothetical protein